MSSAHERVAEMLRSEITEHRWSAGDRIPGEMELAARYGVSRNTVRRALDTLTNANIVRRHQGKGTFVAEQGVSHVLGDLKSFTEIIEDLGMTPGLRDVRVAVDPDPPREAIEFLPGKHLWLVERVRTANGQPFSLMQSWLPDAVAADITPSRLAESQSLYQILAIKEMRPAHATEIIRAEAATLAEARILDIPQGSPLLTIYRWTSDSRGQPIEYVRSTSPGSLYQYVIKLQQ